MGAEIIDSNQSSLEWGFNVTTHVSQFPVIAPLSAILKMEFVDCCVKMEFCLHAHRAVMNSLILGHTSILIREISGEKDKNGFSSVWFNHHLSQAWSIIKDMAGWVFVYLSLFMVLGFLIPNASSYLVSASK